jgi:hypothetical protein
MALWRRYITKRVPNVRGNRPHKKIPVSQQLKTDDVFLVSYPRSGNTWVRNIIAHILYPHDRIRTRADLPYFVPDIYTGIIDHNEYHYPRVIKTHELFAYRHGADITGLYQKNIYLVRHPFKVLQSHYKFLSIRGGLNCTFERFVEMAVCGAMRHGSWQNHVLSWHVMKSELDILFLRYEDLRDDNIRVIQKIAELLGSPVTSEQASVISQKCSRQSMVEMKKRDTLDDPVYADILRQEESQDNVSEVTPQLKEMICKHSQIAMELFGYDMHNAK